MEIVFKSAKKRKDPSIAVTKFPTIVEIAEREEDFRVLQVDMNTMIFVEEVKLTIKNLS